MKCSEYILSNKKMHTFIAVVLAILGNVFANSSQLQARQGPSFFDPNMPVGSYVAQCGFGFEEHTVRTSDGYNLRLFRIPFGPEGQTPNRPVVFLQHGPLQSSDGFIATGPGNALAFILATFFDVWMGNFRANKYSERLDFRPKDKAYYDFTADDLGTKDLPAMIDYVLGVTQQPKLRLVAHGGTEFYIMVSQLPSYNNKIIAHITMSPFIYLQGRNGFLQSVLDTVGDLVDNAMGATGLAEILPGLQPPLFQLLGINNYNVDPQLIPFVTPNAPIYFPIRLLQHYIQMAKTGTFCQFYKGLLANLLQLQLLNLGPTCYDISQVSAPVYLICSSDDPFHSKEDVIALCNRVSNCQEIYPVPEQGFRHSDYLYSLNATELVYTKVWEFIFRQ